MTRTPGATKGGEIAAAAGQREHTTQAFSSKTGAGMMTGQVETDPTLQHPRCVINVLKRHFARYTPEMVERITGISQEQFHEVAETLIANSGRERTSALCYAVGWTRHTSGVQMIRAGAILQLLLGNIGRPGGGILALRGHATIQGSTDIPTLYDLLPGYLNMPHAREGEADARALHRRRRRRQGLVVELRQVHRQPAEGLVRGRGDQGERLRLRAPAEDLRQPQPLPDDAARARRRPGRDPVDRREPRRRLDARRA